MLRNVPLLSVTNWKSSSETELFTNLNQCFFKTLGIRRHTPEKRRVDFVVAVFLVYCFREFILLCDANGFPNESIASKILFLFDIISGPPVSTPPPTTKPTPVPAGKRPGAILSRFPLGFTFRNEILRLQRFRMKTHSAIWAENVIIVTKGEAREVFSESYRARGGKGRCIFVT